MHEKDWHMLKMLHDKANLTQAAAVMRLSQPALSKRLRSIESRFGVQLAHRSKNGVTLTPAGEYLAACSHEMLIKMRDIRERIAMIAQKKHAVLRIASSNFFSRYFLPDILDRFLTDNPETDIILTTASSSEIAAQVARGDVHAGFIRCDSSAPAERELVFTERVFICSRTPLDLADLPHLPQIRYTVDAESQKAFDAWWAGLYLHPVRTSMCVDTVEACAALVERGLGYALLSQSVADRMCNVHKYEAVSAAGSPLRRNTWFIRSSSLEAQTSLNRLAESVRKFSATQSSCKAPMYSKHFQ